jgi:hypothetical protein
MNHRLQRAAAVPSWPSFTGSAQYVGTSPVSRVAVYVDPSLGAPGAKNATDLLADADRVVKANEAIFGTPSQPVNVIVFALDGNSARVSALFEAELSECAMNGNLCGVSTGEALSRWCAAAVSNDALADFASAPTWARKGMPDYVTRTDNTDQNEISIGCGMAFLSWLQSLGSPLNRIAPAMVALGTAGVLAQLYSKLTRDAASNAWPKFLAAVKALPGVKSDDPFGRASRTKRPRGSGRTTARSRAKRRH